MAVILLASGPRFLNSGRVKWLKLLIAVPLLPVCVAAAMALWRVLYACGTADTTWVPFLGGAVCWIILFVWLPRPMWIYVFGHELTHALWTWAFGGRVKRMKVSSEGGHVIIDKNNFLITLAPYFFPLYAVIVVAIFAIGHFFWNWHSYLVYFHLLVGAAYAFHVTLTVHTLRTQQSDITSQGYLFSFTIIFLGNVAVLLLGIPLLTARVGMLDVWGWFFNALGTIFHWLQRLF